MRYSRAWYCGAQIGALVLIAAVSAVVIFLMPPGMAATKGIILAVACVIGFGISLSAYGRSDEVILQTHKTAWFWGSMAALTFAAPLLIVVLLKAVPTPEILPFPHRTPADWFAEGAFLVMLLQSAAALALWTYYNLRRRG